MSRAGGATPILFVSNGHGEDAIAAGIAAVLPEGTPAEAFPLIGPGSAFAGVCPIIGPRANVASEGWRNTRNSLARDIAGGGLGILPPAVRFLREAGRGRRVVAVGDMLLPMLCLAAGLRRIVHVDVYKTGYGRGYSALDRWVLKRVARSVICRNDGLSAALRRDGIRALSPGNVMLDTVPWGDYAPGSKRTRDVAITLLPGSRGHAVENFALQVQGLRLVPEARRPDVFLAVAGSLDPASLGDAAGLAYAPPAAGAGMDLGTLGDGALTIHLASGRALGNLVTGSDFVLAQAGTATVQAIGLGRPAITFRRQDDRPSRLRAESMMFGDGRVLVEPTPQAVAAAILTMLDDPARTKRRGENGRERVGAPGAMEAILAEIAR